MISEQKFIDSAKRIGCSLAAIKAVAQVESGGNGFLPTGEPVILFEPHVFWKRLKAKGLDPQWIVNAHQEYADILYPVWNTKPYGKSSVQHARLQRASKIHKDAALESASWGKFQILAMNWKLCGCKSLQEFINKIYSGEDGHLELFVEYVINTGLDDELIHLNWKGFALGYNGPLYWKNNYDKKLSNAFLSFK